MTEKNLVPKEDFELYEFSVNIDQAVKVFQEYQALKQKLAQEGDFVSYITRDGKTKEMPTKQWRTKLTRFFSIRLEIIKEEVKELPDNSFVINITARATAPNGQFVEALGSCWSKTIQERYQGRDLYHLARTLAETRAKNRAVLELVGFGEVSAEEIEEEKGREEMIDKILEYIGQHKISLEIVEKALQKIAPNKKLEDIDIKEATMLLKYLAKIVASRQGKE